MAESSSLSAVLQPPSRVRPEAFGRFVIALTCLIALLLDPPDHSIASWAVIPMLFGYVVFSLWLLYNELRGRGMSNRGDWIDLGWGLGLTTVTGGSASMLFFVLLLPIISRSFREGFRAGWTLVCVATAAFLILGLPSSPGGAFFEPNRAVTRPLILLVLGYVLAREGGEQNRNQRRLALIADLNTVSNPRMGSERTLLNAARHIRDNYQVQECLVVLGWEGDGKSLYARAGSSESHSQTLPADAVASLLALPDREVRFHRGQTRRGEANSEDDQETGEAVADILATDAFLSVPMTQSGHARARIFLMDHDLSRFDEDETAFLAEASRHLFHIIEKIELLDRLASFAAERERRRLASDLHDLAIQPYLGLQLGLAALLRRSDCPEPVVEELRDLLRLSEQGVDELRRILDGQRAAAGGEDIVVESIARLVDHYRQQFDMDVRFEPGPDLRISDRLATDLLGMVYEGLSNIRRHTTSSWARVVLRKSADTLELIIANEHPLAGDRGFVPRSISDRAATLGGTVDVTITRRGETVLRVLIPL